MECLRSRVLSAPPRTEVWGSYVKLTGYGRLPKLAFEASERGSTP